ncbi:lipase family alpha/beta hydrolase [Nocardia heshunensis]
MRLAIRCFALAVLSAAAIAGPATADQPDPSYSYLGGLAAELAAPGQAPPGANDWSCKPTAAHPNPVVLLHGLGNQTVGWNTLSPVLANAGYCVFSTTYGTGALGDAMSAIAPIADSARQISDFIDRVRAATGSDKVDLVGHSMGGAVPFYLLNHLGGIAKIDHYVALAAPFHGSTVSGAANLQLLLESTGLGTQLVDQCGPCELSPGSQVAIDLNANAAIAPDIRFTTIVTHYDEIATPWTTGLLDGPNVDNVVVQDLCPTDYTEHNELPEDPVAVRVVLDALDPEHAEPVSCAVVLPFLGPVR